MSTPTNSSLISPTLVFVVRLNPVGLKPIGYYEIMGISDKGYFAFNPPLLKKIDDYPLRLWAPNGYLLLVPPQEQEKSLDEYEISTNFDTPLVVKATDLRITRYIYYDDETKLACWLRNGEVIRTLVKRNEAVTLSYNKCYKRARQGNLKILECQNLVINTVPTRKLQFFNHTITASAYKFSALTSSPL